jgi:hypothetical protein
MEVRDQLHASGALTPGKNPVTQLIGDCVSSRADLDVVKKKTSLVAPRIWTPDRPARNIVTKPILSIHHDTLYVVSDSDVIK